MSNTNKRKPGNKASRRAAYLKLRTEHPDASASTLWCWVIDARKLPDVTWRDGVGTLKMHGFDIRISIEPDHLSLGDMGFGEFHTDPREGSIKRFWERRWNQMQYYSPSCSLEERIAYRTRNGMARGPAWLEARQEERREMKRAEDVQAFYVKVAASRNGVELGTAGIGGCGHDTEEGAEESVRDHGLIEEAIAEAREALAGLCGRRCKSKKGA